MGKLTMLAAGAVGYVLGAHAGRERYDQIAQAAGSVWRDPRVQQRKDRAADVAKDTASTAAHRASDTAQQAAGAAGDKIQQATGAGGPGSGTGGRDPLDRPTDPVPDPAATATPHRPDGFPADPGQPDRPGAG